MELTAGELGGINFPSPYLSLSHLFFFLTTPHTLHPWMRHDVTGLSLSFVVFFFLALLSCIAFLRLLSLLIPFLPFEGCPVQNGSSVRGRHGFHHQHESWHHRQRFYPRVFRSPLCLLRDFGLWHFHLPVLRIAPS